MEYVDGYNIKYQPGAYLWQDLMFYARFACAPFTGLTDYSFELDDTGRPFWVITTYKNLRGFALPEATGAVVLDCATGEHQTYSIADLPAWVDRVQPEDFIMTQLGHKGEYVHGLSLIHIFRGRARLPAPAGPSLWPPRPPGRRTGPGP